MRTLHRLGLGPAVLQRVVPPGEGEGLLLERAVQDLELLGQDLHAEFRLCEGKAVDRVVVVIPARPDPDLDASPARVVRRHGHLGQHAGMAERHGRDQGAEADASGPRGEGGQRRPRIERPRSRRAPDRGVVVRAEQAL